MGKSVVISCGPVPARLDCVKFITNRFRGGLAFKTALRIHEAGHDVTVVRWEGTKLPEEIKDLVMSGRISVVSVADVFDYYSWMKEHAARFDAFVMAAAVANLAPSRPYEGKFPSHEYKAGDKFPIEFEIAPRAIDVIKEENPRATLIGYKLYDTDSDDELVEIAGHTLKDAKANIIFANRPDDAKDRKIAVFADGTAIPCSFDEHMGLILDMIGASYFRTEVSPLTEDEKNDPGIRMASAIVRMYEETFPGHGTIAVPVMDMKTVDDGMDSFMPDGTGRFVTTSRGHKGDPVLVRFVDRKAMTVHASGKATLNAPVLYMMMRVHLFSGIIVHRHNDDPRFAGHDYADYMYSTDRYVFPGTSMEYDAICSMPADARHIRIPGHGNLRFLKFSDVDWDNYYRLFPQKYFSIPEVMQKLLCIWDGHTDIELGANRKACTKYAYDRYVSAENALNLGWDEVMGNKFDVAVAKNSINYFSMGEIRGILSRCQHFVANTFISAPDEKIMPGTECAVRIRRNKADIVCHTLISPSDTPMVHFFFAYETDDYEKMGLCVFPYGKNSAMLVKPEDADMVGRLMHDIQHDMAYDPVRTTGADPDYARSSG